VFVLRAPESLTAPFTEPFQGLRTDATDTNMPGDLRTYAHLGKKIGGRHHQYGKAKIAKWYVRTGALRAHHFSKNFQSQSTMINIALHLTKLRTSFIPLLTNGN